MAIRGHISFLVALLDTDVSAWSTHDKLKRNHEKSKKDFF